MSTTLPPVDSDTESTGTPAPARKHNTKLLAAGLTGSSIEWYDFFLYGTAAALVFPTVFFPDVSSAIGALLAFSTFAVGFIARPVGGLLAGHFGDRFGRKPIVVASLAVMALATTLIGLLPSAAVIGSAAPVILVSLRLIQGLACGAQWGGIVLLLTESAPPKGRGLAGCFGQMGTAAGLILGNIAFLLVTRFVAPNAFYSWGWRIPFLAGGLLVFVVMYIQRKVEDSPEFLELEKSAESNPDAKIVQSPLSTAFRTSWRLILLGCGTLAAANFLFNVTTAGLLNYGTEQVGIERTDLLSIVIVGAVLGGAGGLAAGVLSDRVGRRPVTIAGGLGVAVWGFPFFWLVNTGELPMVTVAVLIGFFFQGLAYGALGSYLPEMFPPNIRLSGASLTFQLGAVLFAGTGPLVMTAILTATGSYVGVALCVIGTGLLTAVCMFLLPETNGPEVRRDPAKYPGIHTAVETGR